MIEAAHMLGHTAQAEVWCTAEAEHKTEACGMARAAHKVEALRTAQAGRTVEA